MQPTAVEFDAMRKFVAPEIVYGSGCRHLTGRYAANLRMRHPLVVTDPGVIEAGWADEVLEALTAAGVSSTVFSALTANPKDHEVAAGLRAYREAGCDSLVAVGGGSPMDCAKGIGVVVSNGGDIRSYEGVDRMSQPCPPLLCVPTTSGTGADVSQFAIIGDTARATKMALVGKALVPDVSLTDPQTTATMDAYLTACTGLDALCHAVEAAGSDARSTLTDVHALRATELVFEHLARAVADGGDEAARDGMARASLHAGLAFSNASLGAVHAMAHALGGRHDLAHGECNAILLPHVVEFNIRHVPTAYALLREGLPGARERGLAEWIRELARSVGVERDLRELGVTPDELEDLAALAFADPCLLTNPVSASREELAGIYGSALGR